MAADLLRRVGSLMHGKDADGEFDQENGRPYLVRRQQGQVAVFLARSFEDAEEYAARLLDQQIVLVSLAQVDSALRLRLFDYLNGVSYAIGAQVEKVTDDVLLYVPAPASVEHEVRQPARASWFR